MNLFSQATGPVLWAVAMMAFLPTGAVSAATLRTLPLFMEESARYDGKSSYHLTFGWIQNPARMENVKKSSGVIKTEFSSWNSMSAHVVGEWVLTSTSKTDPSDVEEYRFTVSPLAYADLTVPAPLIQPANFSQVTSPFRVTWSPSTSSPAVGATQIVDFQMTSINPGEREISFGGVRDGNAKFTFSVSSSPQDLNNRVSAASGPTVDPLYEITPRLAFTRRVESLFIPVVGVPEPSAVAMSMMGVAFAAASRRLRHPQG